MAYFESACQGNKGAVATEFFPSFCQGDSASSPASGFYESVLAVGGKETYLQRFTVDQTATSFEIVEG